MTSISKRSAFGTSILMLRDYLTAPVVLCLSSLLLLYGPTVWGLANGLWQYDSHSHGPIVFAVTIWLFFRELRGDERAGTPGRPLLLAGGLLLAFGLVMYALGRSQTVPLMEVGSAIPVVLGTVLLMRGPALARRLWFAFVFMLFLVPLPGSLVDAITQPMKLGVSWAVESIMYEMGYPIGRSGVVLGIGPYKLFVADACAGLNSLFMLEAFGLLYLNVVRHASPLRNTALAILIVPISFISNVVRVVILAMVTYHFGDEAGQGFIHGFSGMVLFVVALLLTIAVDAGLRAVVQKQEPDGAHVQSFSARHTGHTAAARIAPIQFNRASSRPGLGLLAASGLTVICSWAITPPPLAPPQPVDLAAAIPSAFGEWRRVDLPAISVDVKPKSVDAKERDRPYDSVVMRAYANRRGETVALAIAYAADQRQEVKIHRPELCYPAQGFRVVEESNVGLSMLKNISAYEQSGAHEARASVPGKRLLVRGANSEQTVSYLIRIGSAYPQSGWALRNALFTNGLLRRPNDGVLVRVSSEVREGTNSDASYMLNERFLTDLVAALPESSRRLLFEAET